MVCRKHHFTMHILHFLVSESLWESATFLLISTYQCGRYNLILKCELLNGICYRLLHTCKIRLFCNWRLQTPFVAGEEGCTCVSANNKHFISIECDGKVTKKCLVNVVLAGHMVGYLIVVDIEKNQNTCQVNEWAWLMSVVYVYGTAGLSGEAMLLHSSRVVACVHACSKLCMVKNLAKICQQQIRTTFNSGFKGLSKTNTNSVRKLFQLRI